MAGFYVISKNKGLNQSIVFTR